MHQTCARFSGYSLLLFSPFLLAPTALATSSLVPVTGIEIAKTDTSFLALYSDLGDTCLSNVFSNSRWSTWTGTCLSYLFRPFWWRRHLHLLQKICDYNSFNYRGAKNLLGPGFSCLSGWYLVLDISTKGVSVDLVLSKSFSSIFVGLFSWRHLKSILQILKNDCNNAFASALTAFLMVFFQESSSWPLISN